MQNALGDGEEVMSLPPSTSRALSLSLLLSLSTLHQSSEPLRRDLDPGTARIRKREREGGGEGERERGRASERERERERGGGRERKRARERRHVVRHEGLGL